MNTALERRFIFEAPEPKSRLPLCQQSRPCREYIITARHLTQFHPLQPLRDHDRSPDPNDCASSTIARRTATITCLMDTTRPRPSANAADMAPVPTSEREPQGHSRRCGRTASNDIAPGIALELLQT